MLSRRMIRRFYRNSWLRVPPLGDLERKHVRLQLGNGAWVKSSRFYHGIDEKALRRICARLTPVKAYMSILDFLEPDLVGRKCKLDHSLPAFPGEFLLDVDPPGHLGGVCRHGLPGVCFTCLERATWKTIRAVEAVEWYYHDVEMKGVEFLRNLYAASGLSIEPKTRVTQVEMLRQIIRALGGDPERAALEQAFTKPHRTYVGRPEKEEDALNTLKNVLRDLIRKELLEGAGSPKPQTEKGP